MSKNTTLMSAEAAMQAVAYLPATARTLSAFLAERYEPEQGYAPVHSRDAAAVGIKDRAFRLATASLEGQGVWRVERHAEGRYTANRYFPLFLSTDSKETAK